MVLRLAPAPAYGQTVYDEQGRVCHHAAGLYVGASELQINTALTFSLAPHPYLL